MANGRTRRTAGAGVIENVRDVLSLGFHYTGRHLAGLRGHTMYDTNVRGLGAIRIRPRSSDSSVIRQVIRDRQYDISTFPHSTAVDSHYAGILQRGHTPVIIDAGANIGVSALWFACIYPAATVVAVEPDPNNAVLCRHNTRHHKSIKVVETAIGGSRGSVTLHHSQRDFWAVSTTRENETGEVRVSTVADVLEVAGDRTELFIVKVDIEGFEADLFSTNTEWLSDVAMLIVEPHDWLFPGEGSSRSLQMALANEEFDLLVSGENLVYVRSGLISHRRSQDPAASNLGSRHAEKMP